MNELVEIIQSIVKYGLEPNVNINDKERDLETNLIKLYALYFEIKYQIDETLYEDFDKTPYSNLRNNISNNFPDFGFYYALSNSHKIIENAEVTIGDAIDDLMDIILDLLEIKWRSENNSHNDALQYFEFIFTAHTQSHLIGLLAFIKSKKG
jgi:hypothetical protein